MATPKTTRMYWRLADHLDGLACVHECALASTGYINIPRKLICNPFYNIKVLIEKFGMQGKPYQERDTGFIAPHTYKRWKHMDDLIRAIAYMKNPKPENEQRIVAGKGIEYRYMNAHDKCRPEYRNEKGERIWDVALNNGMTNLDWIKYPSEYMQNIRVVVDPSWSLSYASRGAHWNRTGIEAMIYGAILVAQEIAMTAINLFDNNKYDAKLFHPMEHYVPLKENMSSQEYADQIYWANNLHLDKVTEIQKNCWNLLPKHFDAKLVAQQFIDFANGNEAGCMNSLPDNSMQAKCDKILEEFYNYPKQNQGLF